MRAEDEAKLRAFVNALQELCGEHDATIANAEIDFLGYRFRETYIDQFTAMLRTLRGGALLFDRTDYVLGQIQGTVSNAADLAEGLPPTTE